MAALRARASSYPCRGVLAAVITNIRADSSTAGSEIVAALSRSDSIARL
jgi:hypothetical protein